MPETTVKTDSPDISTASPEEIARFTKIADSWWDPNGEFKPLHQLNPLRTSYIVDHLCQHFGRDADSERPLEGLKLIDIGCGGGLLCEPMRQLGATVSGIDAGEKSLAIARVHAQKSGLEIDYRHVLPEDLASESAVYDVVLNMEVIEHVTDLNTFFAASTGLLKPGGAMFLSTVNRTFKSLALAKVAAEYILRWLPAGTHDWRKFVKPSEMAKALRRVNVDIKGLQGLSYAPITDEWYPADDLGVNYMAYAVKD